jgi:hypothetical protein
MEGHFCSSSVVKACLKGVSLCTSLGVFLLFLSLHRQCKLVLRSYQMEWSILLCHIIKVEWMTLIGGIQYCYWLQWNLFYIVGVYFFFIVFYFVAFCCIYAKGLSLRTLQWNVDIEIKDRGRKTLQMMGTNSFLFHSSLGDFPS